MNGKKLALAAHERQENVRQERLNRLRFCLMNFTFLFILSFGFGSISIFTSSWAQTAVGWLWALASLSSGAFVGLLFGIPRMRQPSSKEKPTDLSADYQPEINNNLIEVSDWLTKIIVGLGLIELSSLPSKLKSLAMPLATCLGSECALAMAIAIIIFFAVTGFLIGFIDSRTVLALLFRKSDDQLLAKDAIKQEVKQEVEQEMGENVRGLAEAITPAAISLIKPSPDNLRFREEALRKLLDILKALPTNRTATIYAGRLFRSLNQLDRAIAVIEETLKKRREVGIVPNEDDAALLFNKACYYNLLGDSASENGKTEEAEAKKNSAWKDLVLSCQLDKKNKGDATADSDLKTLFKPEVRDFTSL
jgi:tetratricopeptide (TPR) repeat protein